MVFLHLPSEGASSEMVSSGVSGIRTVPSQEVFARTLRVYFHFCQ